VEADIKAMFPQARTLRWDWDTTRQKDAHEIILTHFANHQADVLVGTQMLAKDLTCQWSPWLALSSRMLD
jgi:primosomal protein N' (replication factor Y)